MKQPYIKGSIVLKRKQIDSYIPSISKQLFPPCIFLSQNRLVLGYYWPQLSGINLITIEIAPTNVANLYFKLVITDVQICEAT